MPKLADWVKETVSGTPGTGNITFGGAVAGYCRFQDQFTTGDLVKYVAIDGNNKEEGIGTVTSGTPWTMARTLVQQTINAGTFNKSSPTAISLTSAAIIGISASADTSGVVVGTALATLSSIVPCTTILPLDNTIPQNNEGDEVLTITYTPKFADSIIQVEAFIVVAWTDSTIGRWPAASLFVDTVANALKTTYVGYSLNSASTAYKRLPLRLYYEAVSGNTTSRTYKLRCGPDTAGTLYVNGSSVGTAVFNGINDTFLKITEVRQ